MYASGVFSPRVFVLLCRNNEFHGKTQWTRPGCRCPSLGTDPGLLGYLSVCAGSALGASTLWCCAHWAWGYWVLLGKPRGPECIVLVPLASQSRIPDTVAKPLLPSRFLTKLQKYPRVGEAVLESGFNGNHLALALKRGQTNHFGLFLPHTFLLLLPLAPFLFLSSFSYAVVFFHHWECLACTALKCGSRRR